MASTDTFFKWFVVVVGVLLLIKVVRSSEDTEPKVNSLKQVIVVFRHGERSPQVMYRNSPHQSTWKEGLDQLTLTGKTHMYKLGQWLRERYKHLVESGYQSDKLNVMSSAVEHCVMSAQAMLAGLMPPPEDARINPDLDWQPIPVRYLPEKDGLLLMEKSCPKMDKELDITLSSDAVKDLNIANADLFKFLTEKTGENVSDVMDASKIYDALVSEHSHGLKVPEWSKEVFPEKLQELSAIGKSLITNSTTMKRLRGGPLLMEITNHMKDKAKNADSEKGKICIYAVNDQTIYDLIRSLGFDEFLEVDFGSCVLFELYEHDDNKWAVRVLYFNMNYLDQPKKLDVPGCGEECDLETFVQSLIPVIPQNYDEECNVN